VIKKDVREDGCGCALRAGGKRWRGLLVLVALLVTVATGPAAAKTDSAAASFDFEAVARAAEALAAEPFRAPAANLPEALERLGYDDYRKIRFKRDAALWRGKALFEVQLFHLGFLYTTPVRINVVRDGRAQLVAYRPEMFDLGGLALPERPAESMGFAGFRVHFPLHTPDYKDEVAVFLGASYFRVLGRGQRFGASARGLAIDTGEPKGEEFPLFREFWLVEPGPEDTDLTFYALLDSPSLTGAYAFRLHPGTETVTQVRARVFLRQDVKKLGIAPLTSMFLYGENRTRRFDDHRPEVHDSDGLLMDTGAGERLWRPLSNPGDLRVSAFVDARPRGFGLMQRDRAYDRYLDLEARYDLRPSLWVESLGDWGEGHVELVEIPSKQEINDNIVAYWRPKQEMKAGARLDVAYRLSARSDGPPPPYVGRAVRTRIGAAAVPGSPDPLPPEVRLFVIDFAGGDMPYLGEAQPVRAVVRHSAGRLVDVVTQRSPEDGHWRVAFRLDTSGTEAIDLMVHLELRGRRLTETWSGLWTPDLFGS